MSPKPHQYEFVGFLADVRLIEELKASWSWSSPGELDAHIARYFIELHGTFDIDYAKWRYTKWKAVMVYVSRNMHAFDVGDLAVVGSERAVSHGKLFHPIFDYAVEHDIADPSAFPEPRFFHNNAA